MVSKKSFTIELICFSNEKLISLSDWLKSLPCAGGRKIKEHSSVLDKTVITAVHDALTEFKVNLILCYCKCLRISLNCEKIFITVFRTLLSCIPLWNVCCITAIWQEHEAGHAARCSTEVFIPTHRSARSVDTWQACSTLLVRQVSFKLFPCFQIRFIYNCLLFSFRACRKTSLVVLCKKTICLLTWSYLGSWLYFIFWF